MTSEPESPDMMAFGRLITRQSPIATPGQSLGASTFRSSLWRSHGTIHMAEHGALKATRELRARSAHDRGVLAVRYSTKCIAGHSLFD